MYRIARKKVLNFNTTEYDIEAPLVAKNCRGGQFVILRVDENGERVPFTIADYDRDRGTVTVIVQTIGASTYKLSLKNEGEYIADFVGPLGNPTDLEAYENVILVGGGIGSAVIYPQTAELKRAGKNAIVTALVEKFFNSVGHKALFAVTAVVGHYNEFVGSGAEIVFVN